MTQERFRQILEAYGADPRRWPDGERAAAAAFAQGHAEARRALIEADRLDSALDGWSGAEPGPALRARVLASAPRPRTARLFAPWIAGLAASLAAACLAGVMFGVYLAQPAIESARQDATILAAMRDLSSDGAPATPRVADDGEVG